LITAQQRADADLAAKLKAFCDERGLLFQSNAEVLAMFDRQISGFMAFTWILLTLVFVVASLGIVNTLTMNVLEQTRDVGVLRAIGMKRRQVGKTILSQAIALAVISLIPGVPVGIALAYFMNLATHALVGQPVQFRLDAPIVGGCALLALVIATLAAFWPARRATRLPVVQALQYE
jgi:putative ABC transport system permease protein